MSIVIRPTRRFSAIVLAVVVALPAVYNPIRWAAVERVVARAPRLTVAMVQPNVPQNLKWRPETVKATPGKSFRIEKTLTASSEKGSYALRIRLSGAGKTAERTVDLTIE